MSIMEHEEGNEGKKKEKKPEFRTSLSDAYKKFDSDLVKVQDEDKKKKKGVLEEGISKVEKKSIKELRSSKMLVAKILDIRQKAGMSQTVGTSGKVKAPMIFGKDEFKQKLARELLVIGTEELDDIGGAITLANLVDYFRETRPKWEVRTGEILSVLKELEKADVIPKRVDIGEDEVLIRFKPIEMSKDIQDVLRLSTGLDFLSVNQVTSHLGWPIERAQSTLTLMMKIDIAILDESTGNYYFPGTTRIE